MGKQDKVLVDMPQFKFRGMQYAELTEIYKCQTPIVGHIASIPHVLLSDDGLLMVTAGYHYDFGSGPAVDTPAMIYASLAHDCFYDLMKADELPWDARPGADKFFRAQLLEAGMNPLRAWWCYWGVRIGYPIMQWWSGDREHDTRRS